MPTTSPATYCIRVDRARASRERSRIMTRRRRDRGAHRRVHARPEREADLAAVLARYVVLTRGEPGCRNVDLLDLGHREWPIPRDREVGLGRDRRGRTSTPTLMTEMAAAAVPLLAEKPTIDLLDTISAHDLTEGPLRPAATAGRYFWRRMSTGTFEGPRSAAPVSLQISRMPGAGHRRARSSSGRTRRRPRR